jgi:hypothetical protein
MVNGGCLAGHACSAWKLFARSLAASCQTPKLLGTNFSGRFSQDRGRIRRRVAGYLLRNKRFVDAASRPSPKPKRNSWAVSQLSAAYEAFFP